MVEAKRIRKGARDPHQLVGVPHGTGAVGANGLLSPNVYTPGLSCFLPVTATPEVAIPCVTLVFSGAVFADTTYSVDGRGPWPGSWKQERGRFHIDVGSFV